MTDFSTTQVGTVHVGIAPGVAPGLVRLLQFPRGDAYPLCLAELTPDQAFDLASILASTALTVARDAANLTPKPAAASASQFVAPPAIARPEADYHDDLGSVTWWKFPIEEAPWIGRPGDSDWPGYHTHFTPAPALPLRPWPPDILAARANAPGAAP